MNTTEGMGSDLPSVPGDRGFGSPSPRGNISPLVSFRGAVSLKPQAVCDAETNCILEDWNARRSMTHASLELFHRLGDACMLVDADCRPAGYLPDAQSNTLSETLIREFLFPDGLRLLRPGPAFVLRAQYSLIALQGFWHLLVCPIPDPGTDIPVGAIVVHIDRHLTDRTGGRRLHQDLGRVDVPGPDDPLTEIPKIAAQQQPQSGRRTNS
ncbi:MAG: hypothetical protein RDA78_05825 [Roseibium sp.]|uniref:hypothetical protein n=1 Tax=Roseibium sp. TaxID=1936156 RepID=UPI003D9C3CE0